MKKILFYAAIIPSILIVLVQPACNPIECFKRTGNIVTEDRQVADFTTIMVNDNIKLLLRNDSSNTVTVKAGSNLIKSVKTEVEGTILKITNENTCNWARSFKTDITVTVGARFIQNLEQFGFNEVKTLDTIEVNDLNILCKNSGDLTLALKGNDITMFTSSSSYVRISGSSNSAFLHTNGQGEILAQSFKVLDLRVLHENINTIRVFPINTLDVTFNPENTGNVLYYNEPQQITVNGTGSGKVIKK
ncbi:MAG TPA: hypothetical protein DCS93_07660 [Microscillaceae bacterium]|nr:hypothetical protein [Microscillaceae bacterium]